MIWLIGNKGMLGSEVEVLLRESEMQVACTDRDVDITNAEAIGRFLESLNPFPPQWIINCAAYTAVDRAEDESEFAFAVNAAGPLNLAYAARATGATLVHISTDYVFNGEKEQDYDEEDATDPINAYGKSKLQGEVSIRETLSRYYIIRTAWLYGKNGKNFVNTMLKLFQERRNVKVVCDQFGNPTYAADLARFVIAIISPRPAQNYGVYHYTNEGRTSWYDFAKSIHEETTALGKLNLEVEIAPVMTSEYPTRAKRPRSSCLSKEKAKRELEVSIRGWRDALRSYLKLQVESAGCGVRPGDLR